MLHDSESAVQALRWCEHGETVHQGKSTKGCSGCINGHCGAALACMQPEPEPPKPRRRLWPTTREAWGRCIGGAFGLGGALLFAREAARYFF